MLLRIVSIIVLFVVLLVAQQSIGLGPGGSTLSIGLVDTFNWHAATPSGCPGGMCVGSGNILKGDTIYANAWFANASLLPFTSGLPIVATVNDATTTVCSGGVNIGVIQMAGFSWTNRNAGYFGDINCMFSYGSSINEPAGWFGHCTNGDDGTQGCGWKSRTPFVQGGKLYLPVERQISSGSTTVHDATMIRSDDGGLTWRNPATIAASGAAVSNGDAPLCGAVNNSIGSNCLAASYAGSIMWSAMPFEFSAWNAIQYGQDGATMPSGVLDGCDPNTYRCFFSGEQEMAIARVLITDLPNLNVANWQYYTCPNLSDSFRCSGLLSSSWTSTLANRSSTLYGVDPTRRSASYYSIHNGIFGMAYIKEFHAYLATGYSNWGGDSAPIYFWAPAPYGPWVQVAVAPPTNYSAAPTNSFFPGFFSPSLAMPYTVISTNPPHVLLTGVADTGQFFSNTTPFFTQIDLQLGKAPNYPGNNVKITNKIFYTVNAGFTFTDAHTKGTFPLSGMTLAYDFYDHGGLTAFFDSVPGFHDVLKGNQFMLLCANTVTCGSWNPGQGSNLTDYGVQMVNGGYGPQFKSVNSISNWTETNAPAAMTGNGTFTVASVFRMDTDNFTAAPVWWTGDASGTNTGIGLIAGNVFDKPFRIAWGSNTQNHYQLLTAFTPVLGNWLFCATTIQANGASPITHLWCGVSGALVDLAAGIGRTVTGGTPIATPAVAAAPLRFAREAPTVTDNINASYGMIMVGSKVFSYPELQVMYNSAKIAMARRGVTVQ